jgi:ribosomal protein L37AE/L43A
MSFDAIPEDREESHPCHCGGNITKRKSTSGSNAIIWECDNCNFESTEKGKTNESP